METGQDEGSENRAIAEGERDLLDVSAWMAEAARGWDHVSLTVGETGLMAELGVTRGTTRGYRVCGRRFEGRCCVTVVLVARIFLGIHL